MTVENSVKHIHWRLDSLTRSKLTDRDVDSLNTIIKYVKFQDQTAQMENRLFAKLFVDKFMFLAMDGKRSANGCIEEIERILKLPMWEVMQQFRKKVPYFKLERILEGFNPISEEDTFNMSKYRERALKVAQTMDKELVECLKTEYTEEQAIGFINHEVNRLATKYQNLD
jgi:hypothetical protein